MRCVGGVSDQEQVALPPGSSAQRGKADPPAVVTEQGLSMQRVCEHLGAERHPRLVALTWIPGAGRCVSLTAARPAALLELDDERAHLVAVRIRVGLHGSDVRFRDEELERLEDQGRAQPHVACVPHVERRLEYIGARVSGQAVDAVGRDDEVACGAQPLEWRSRLAVVDGHARLFASLAQDCEQPLPADCRKRVPSRGEDPAAVVNVDVVPDRKVFGEPLVESRVRVFDSSERLVREHDPEPERVVCCIPFPDLDPGAPVQKLDQCRQVEPCRPPADDRDVQRTPRGRQLPSRSRKRCNLPVAVRGSSLANSIARGYLYGAIWLLTKSCSVFAGSGPSSAPSRSTTTALTIMPRSSSGAPTTAASATAGCRRSASSTSGPSMMRIPHASWTASQVACGSVSPADTHARSEVSRAAPRSGTIARYAMGAVASTVMPWRSIASSRRGGAGCSSRYTAAPARNGKTTLWPSPNVKARGGLAPNRSC